MNSRTRSVLFGLGLAALVLAGCGPRPVAEAPTAAPLPASTPVPTEDPYPGWTTYADESSGLSFRYPSNWFGPEVYPFEDGVRIEVGSDVVYPYGTGLDEREPGEPNSFGIVIQFTRNRAGWTLEQYRAEQPWLNDTLAVLDLQDGKSVTTARSLTTRVRGLTLGRFTGAEFVTTLPDTAQTERVYLRSAFLMDDVLNVVQVMGSPQNVEVADPAAWRAAFEAVDAANLEAFRGLVDSIQVE